MRNVYLAVCLGRSLGYYVRWYWGFSTMKHSLAW